MEGHLATAERLIDAATGGNRAIVLARIGRMRMLAGRFSESEVSCREAIGVAGADAGALASAYITLGTVLADLGRFDEMERSFAEGKVYAEASGSPEELSRWYNNYARSIAGIRGREAKEAVQRDGLEALRRLGLERSAHGVALTLNLVGEAHEAVVPRRRSTSCNGCSRRHRGHRRLGCDGVAIALLNQARYDEAREAVSLSPPCAPLGTPNRDQRLLPGRRRVVPVDRWIGAGIRLAIESWTTPLAKPSRGFGRSQSVSSACRHRRASLTDGDDPAAGAVCASCHRAAHARTSLWRTRLLRHTSYRKQ
jgi:hypothetical protein